VRGNFARLGKKIITLVLTTAILSTVFIPELVFASSITNKQIVELINKRRLENNSPPISSSFLLSEAAYKRAQDMVTRNYWSHQTPEGLPFSSFVDSKKYPWVYLGENLAANFTTSERIVEAWLESPAHRRNVLNPEWQDIGVGVSQNVVVVIFGKKRGDNFSFFQKIPRLFSFLYHTLLNNKQ